LATMESSIQRREFFLTHKVLLRRGIRNQTETLLTRVSGSRRCRASG
jgi:hypothetical protein